MEVNVHEAKTHLSRLLKRVAAGEEITIARAGVPVARMVAVAPASAARPLGAMEGQIYIAEDFDAPLPDDILAGFYGGKPKPKRKQPGRAKSGRSIRKRVSS
jgi:prevent-host-death family protein